MLKYLRRLFIPHRGNRYRPQFFKIQIILFVLAGASLLHVIALTLPNFLQEKDFYTADIIKSVLVAYANDVRTAQNIAPLQESPLLTRAAQEKANDMAQKGYFAHYRPEDGREPWAWIRDVKYEYAYAGENLALHFTESKDVVEGWIASPKHYANIIKGSYTEVGTGIATGTYDGVESIVVVQFYASPGGKATQEKPAEMHAPKQYAMTNKATSTLPQKIEVITEITESSSENKTGTTTIAYTAPLTSVLGVSTQKNDLLRSIIYAPKMVALYATLALLVLTVVAYILAILIHARIQHQYVIRNGAVLIMCLLLLVFVNNTKEQTLRHSFLQSNTVVDTMDAIQ